MKWHPRAVTNYIPSWFYITTAICCNVLSFMAIHSSTRFTCKSMMQWGLAIKVSVTLDGRKDQENTKKV